MTAQVSATPFPRLLQRYFCEYLIQQRDLSPQTVASYRDTFRLLLCFAGARLKQSPAELLLEDLHADLVLEFLQSLEATRNNSVRTRNTRLAAIRSFMRYAALQDPGALPGIQRVLAIPTKRFNRPLLDFLTRDEIEAILEAPDSSTWSGRRDRAMFATFYNTGARVSEIIALRVADLTFGDTVSIHLKGKGRKQRTLPLWRPTSRQLRRWIIETGNQPNAVLFANRLGRPLSRSGVQDRLRVAALAAARCCPGLDGRKITPHTLRHTTAMHLLQSGVDITVIALWLGHESPATTHHYIEADLAMKQRALACLEPPAMNTPPFIDSDPVMAFLKGL